MFLLLIACTAAPEEAPVAAPSAAEAPAPSPAPPARDEGETAPTMSSADRLYELLQGQLSSAEQAAKDPDHYHNITLEMCAIAAPELGARALYVEQATAEKPDAPYRQRVYLIRPSERLEVAVSEVYELNAPAAAVGLCDDPSRLRLTPADLSLREGCAVHMGWNGAQFKGGTRGEGCASALQGASYATSEVTLTQDELLSWDRGFNADGQQVWGAEAGPTVFKRRAEVPLAP